jgi:NTP pyrophosphatase (non-canonical NTP hydrolase)
MQTRVGKVNAANGWRMGAGLRDELAHVRAHYEPSGTYRKEVEQRVVDHQIAVLALITTEVAEAIEEIRNGHDVAEERHTLSGISVYRGVSGAWYSVVDSAEWPALSLPKPEGVPSELADVVIRALDFAETWGIDLESIIAEKVEYNATRGHRHGGKAL